MDFLSKATKKNEGELPQYYIENSHPAIISPETFDLAQSEIKRRRPLNRKQNSSSIFAAKLICGECGGYYGSKVWHSTSKYRCEVWRCNRKYSGKIPCKTPLLRKEDIQAGFVAAFNEILGDKQRYIAQFEELLPLLADTAALELKQAEAQNASDTANQNIHSFMQDNTKKVQNQDEYIRRFNEMSDICKVANALIEKIADEILEQKARRERITRYLNELRQHGDILQNFDENLWRATVESVTVQATGTLVVKFKGGSDVEVKPGKNR